MYQNRVQIQVNLLKLIEAYLKLVPQHIFYVVEPVMLFSIIFII